MGPTLSSALGGGRFPPSRISSLAESGGSRSRRIPQGSRFETAGTGHPPRRWIGSVPSIVASIVPMFANGPSIRLLPRLDDDNRFFWTGGKDGVLRFLKCGSCHQLVHPPVPVCPACLGKDLA